MSGNKTIAAEWSASNMPACFGNLTHTHKLSCLSALVAPSVLISFFVSEFSENS